MRGHDGLNLSCHRRGLRREAQPEGRVYWLDPSCDFQPVHCAAKRGFAVVWQIDVQHDRVANVGWLPARWTVLRFGDRAYDVRQIVEARRTDLDLERAVPDGGMKAEYPPWTWVVDTLARRENIVRDDRSEYVLDQPYSKPLAFSYHYDELVKSAQGRGGGRWAFGPGSIRKAIRGLVQWRGIVVSIVIILAVAVLAKGRLSRGAIAPSRPALPDDPKGPPDVSGKPGNE